MPTTKVTRDVFDGSVRPISSIDIDGGSIDGTPIGANTPDVGFFTNLEASNLTVTNSVDFSGASLTGVNAFYADLAERYESDHMYEPGTVVKLGGEKEITKTTLAGDVDVFGVISSDPAFTMNSQPGQDDTMLPVAMIGRVPCKVVGPVRKGQRLVATPEGMARAVASTDTSMKIFARSLVDDRNTEPRLVEVVINTIK